MSRRRGRDACSPAAARLRIARRQLRPHTFDPASVVVKFDGVEVQVVYTRCEGGDDVDPQRPPRVTGYGFGLVRHLSTRTPSTTARE